MAMRRIFPFIQCDSWNCATYFMCQKIIWKRKKNNYTAKWSLRCAESRFRSNGSRFRWNSRKSLGIQMEKVSHFWAQTQYPLPSPTTDWKTVRGVHATVTINLMEMSSQRATDLDFLDAISHIHTARMAMAIGNKCINCAKCVCLFIYRCIFCHVTLCATVPIQT